MLSSIAASPSITWFPVDYVDIHAHILHGLDDGAKDLRASVAMLEMAAAAGTTDIVATPHANSRFPFNPQLIDERIAELVPLSPVRIHRGCDFRLQFDTVQDAFANPTKYTINHGVCLLVEFPDFTVFPNGDNVLMQLVDAGLVPIITHPERNEQLRERIENLTQWVEMGCGLQITAGAVTGRFGAEARAFAALLLSRGLVHFVASDAHDTRHRPPKLDGAYAALSREWGEATIRPLFVDNPRATLSGRRIEFDIHPPVRRKRQWYQFW